ncbi:stonustoxin subunit beta-like [Pempheris klunzingeri]|uniref:stonustoxin subunit beta-like n=1 Tax=Pempheris klunzingeri TaxID=3127111 RepID=UPI00397F6CBD
MIIQSLFFFFKCVLCFAVVFSEIWLYFLLVVAFCPVLCVPPRGHRRYTYCAAISYYGYSFRVDHGGAQRLKPGLLKYACELSLDPNTTHRSLILSENNRHVKNVEEEQPYPYHPERFDHCKQLLCGNGLTGRCYWEADMKGHPQIAVAYGGISRRGDGKDNIFGRNDKSWELQYSAQRWVFQHNDRTTYLNIPHKPFHKVAVYLDWPAGTVSFYTISSDTLTCLYSFYNRFAEPLYPGFGLACKNQEVRIENLASGCSPSLCQKD